jgi:D-lactate dehydrogenase
MQSHKGLVDGVVSLAKRIQADRQLTNLIRRKFAIKCTTGYSLNALVSGAFGWATIARSSALPRPGEAVCGPRSLLCLPAGPRVPPLLQVDFPVDDPIEIVKRLVIGSEGTLAFVSRATYNTVPEWPHKVRGLQVSRAALWQQQLPN